VKQRNTTDKPNDPKCQACKSSTSDYIVSLLTGGVLGVLLLLLIAGPVIDVSPQAHTSPSEQASKQATPLSKQGSTSVRRPEKDVYRTQKTLCYVNRSDEVEYLGMASNEMRCWGRRWGSYFGRTTNFPNGDDTADYKSVTRAERLLTVSGARYHFELSTFWGDRGFDYRLMVFSDGAPEIIRCSTFPFSANNDVGYVGWPESLSPVWFRCGDGWESGGYRSIPQPSVSKNLTKAYPGMQFWSWKFPATGVQISVGAIKAGKDGKSTLLEFITKTPVRARG
jgi:hypothetical protein